MNRCRGCLGGGLAAVLSLVVGWNTGGAATASDALSASDQMPLNQRQAHVSPAWLTDGVMYQIWLRGFTPEGTLNAAAKRLPKLAELGVTLLYLSPICVQDDDPDPAYWSPRQRLSGNPKNPYRIKDYENVDPEYGTREDLRFFVQEAHRLGLRVLLDTVYLHSGPSAVVVKRYPAFIKRTSDGKPALNQWNFFSFDFALLAVREYFWGNLVYWLKESGCDGFRCDVSDEIPLDFWEEARSRLARVRPDIVLLAEGLRVEDQLAAFDLDYTFGFEDAWGSAAKVRALWKKMADERPRGGAKFIRYVENHDLAHNGGTNRIERAWGGRRMEATLTALFMLDGVPFLYNGQEIADVSLQSLYASCPIDWAAGETPKGRSRFAFCQKLCALRRSEKALTRGTLEWLETGYPDAVLACRRTAGGERILAWVNLSSNADSLRIESAAPFGRPLLASGASPSGNQKDGFVFLLNGYGYYVGKDECAQDGGQGEK